MRYAFQVTGASMRSTSVVVCRPAAATTELLRLCCFSSVDMTGERERSGAGLVLVSSACRVSVLTLTGDLWDVGGGVRKKEVGMRQATTRSAAGAQLGRG